jgi:hypothetical protein
MIAIFFLQFLTKYWSVLEKMYVYFDALPCLTAVRIIV